jgi:hypothetical protein
MVPGTQIEHIAVSHSIAAKQASIDITFDFQSVSTNETGSLLHELINVVAVDKLAALVIESMLNRRCAPQAAKSHHSIRWKMGKAARKDPQQVLHL